MKIGSDEHKELFCRAFIASHLPYVPAELPWPELDAEGHALLAGIPFWGEALGMEGTAGPMIEAVAERWDDPLIREALLLQAFEETRHAGIIRTLLDRYGIEATPAPIERPKGDPEAGYVEFGFEECVDSFGAFGIFRLARESALLPDPLFDIFDRVMQEELNHVVFFVNWFAWRQARRGGLQRALRHPLAAWSYGKAIVKRMQMAFGDRGSEGEGFTVTGGTAFVEQLSVGRVVSTCLAENERRLVGVDPRLLRPRFAPALSRAVQGVTRLAPGRRDAPGTAARSGSADRAA